ncbi:MAG: alkaline phosphatase family protein [Kiloniellales bacterium]|nr:alkaline phosphatase family protein [Kiloniellales bacterium]
MTARLLFVGFDAAGAPLLERWAEAGDLPNLARLRKDATSIVLDTPMETLPGAIWTEIVQGRPCHVESQFFHYGQAFPEEGAIRRLRESDIDPDHQVWADCSRADLRCAVVDVPFQAFLPDFNGIQLREWAQHDLWLGPKSDPEPLFEELSARFGPIPMHEQRCDVLVHREGRAALLQALTARARCKTEMLAHLLEREAWDLFYCVYGEGHCAGHQLWPAPQWNWSGRAGSERGPEDRWAALREVYREMDAGLGRLMAAAGPEARVVFVASHGIGPYIGGPQLLPEVLIRLGLSAGPDTGARRALRTAIRPLRHLPPALKRLVYRLRRLPGPAWLDARAGTAGVGSDDKRLGSPVCKALTVNNNRCGAVRLNLRGRDRYGIVPPEDAEPLMAFIEQELLALTDPGSGRRLVARVERADDLFGAERSPLVPDLIVVFRSDLGAIEACESPSIGRFRYSLHKAAYKRMGDHTPDSRAWIRAPGFPAGLEGASGNVLDLAPTILSLLDVPVPAEMTGVALDRALSSAA